MNKTYLFPLIDDNFELSVAYIIKMHINRVTLILFVFLC